MNSNITSHSAAYSDDAPKVDPWKDDKLGFKRFAKRLSAVIATMQAPNGYVIGLHGVWGSGKSTALNFIQAYLKKHNDENTDDKVLVINFSPWMVSGHQHLVGAFFKVLAEALEPEIIARRRSWQKWVKWFRRTSSPLMTAAGSIGAAMDPSAIGAKAAVKFTSASFDKMLDHWLAEPSLQDSHAKLIAKLQKKNQRILIIIDDIDRLLRDEIRATMQLVKSVGRLPNVIYLLAYDRQVVWGALNEYPDLQGLRPSFAEKIVQQEVELPLPSMRDILSLLDHEISFLLRDIPEDGKRWHNLITHGIRRWIRQPRDVARLANALKFCGPALQDEVDPQDLLAMEGLRIFDRPVFDWIRASRDFMFSEGAFEAIGNQERAAYAARFKERLLPENRDDVIELLCDLFPNIAQLLTDQQQHFGEVHYQVVRRRGVGVQLGYDAYFSLYPSAEGVPKPTLDALIRKIDDTDAIVAVFREYLAKLDSNGRSMIGELLHEVSIRFYGRDSLRPSAAILRALLICGDAILSIDEPAATLVFSPRSTWSNLIGGLLGKWGREEATRHLLDSLNAVTSQAVWAAIYFDRGWELGVLSEPEQNRKQLLTDAGFEELGTRLHAILEAGVAAGSLSSAHSYGEIIIAWQHLSGDEPVKQWISQGSIDSAEFLNKLSSNLLVYSIGMRGRRQYVMRHAPDVRLYDAALLLEAANRHLATGTYNENDAGRVQALKAGLESLIARDAKVPIVE